MGVYHPKTLLDKITMPDYAYGSVTAFSFNTLDGIDYTCIELPSAYHLQMSGSSVED